MFWNPSSHSDDENSKWCWLRAMEWGKWPSFIFQPVAPILFIYFDWWKIILIVILLNWLWVLFRYKYINLFLLGFGSIFVHLKWFSSFGVGIYFILQKHYFLAVLSGLWPLFSMIFQILSPPTKIGIIQNKLMEKFGYTRPQVES